MVNVRFSILWELNAIYLQLIEGLWEKGMVICTYKIEMHHSITMANMF